MRARQLIIATLAAAVVGCPVAAPAALADAGAPVTTVGGPRLASSELVADPLPGAPRLPRVAARSWLVADLDSGDVLAAKDPHGRFLPASTLKILTALTLIPRLDPAGSVVPTWADVAVDGSKVGIVDGLPYPIDQLFTAMLVVSGNDAANALATAAGGHARTIALMNAEAERLRALDTHAVTPSGLDAPGQTSSAYDLAVIARAAMQLPAFRRYVSTVQSYVNAPHGRRFQIYTHDKLLTHYPGAIGVKNGYTEAAQATFVGAATRGGHTLVVTLMHAEPAVWKDAEALLDWGFAAEGHVSPVGTLLTAQPAPARAALRAAPVREAAPAASGTGVAPLPMGLGVTGAVLFVWTYGGRALRWRRRRRRLRGT